MLRYTFEAETCPYNFFSSFYRLIAQKCINANLFVLNARLNESLLFANIDSDPLFV